MPWGITLAAMAVASIVVAVYVSWPLLVGRPEGEADTEEDDGESMVDHLLVQKEATYSAIKELEFDRAMGNLSSQDYEELSSRYEERAIALLRTIDEVSEQEPDGPGAVETASSAARSASPARGAAVEDEVERQVAALRKKPRRDGRSGGRLEEEIEREVAELRMTRQRNNTGADDPGDAVEREVAALRAAEWRRADSAPPDATPHVSSARPVCPSCATPVRNPSAAFCSRCGASLRAGCPKCGERVEMDDVFCPACGSSLAAGDNRRPGNPALGGSDA